MFDRQLLRRLQYDGVIKDMERLEEDCTPQAYEQTFLPLMDSRGFLDVYIAHNDIYLVQCRLPDGFIRTNIPPSPDVSDDDSDEDDLPSPERRSDEDDDMYIYTYNNKTIILYTQCFA